MAQLGVEAIKLRVPMRIDLKFGCSWGDTEPLGGAARRSAIRLTGRRSYSLLAYKPRDFEARDPEAAGDIDCRAATRNPIRVAARCRSRVWRAADPQ